ADLRTKFVVSHKFLTLANVFAIRRMFDQTIYIDRDGFRHFIRSDNADLFGAFAFCDLLRFAFGGIGLCCLFRRGLFLRSSLFGRCFFSSTFGGGFDRSFAFGRGGFFCRFRSVLGYCRFGRSFNLVCFLLWHLTFLKSFTLVLLLQVSSPRSAYKHAPAFFSRAGCPRRCCRRPEFYETSGETTIP